MCTLILYYKLLKDYPIVVAANRDEQYSRKARGPDVIHQHPRVYAGIDEQAGGTWLGVNEFGLMVGVLNRHSPQPQDPARRSRGLLCRDLLCQKDAKAARNVLIAEGRARLYNSFYFVWADAEHAYVASNEGDITMRDLAPGRYLLTNSSLIDLSRLTPAGIGDFLSDPTPASLDALFATFQAVCQSHQEVERIVDAPNEHRGNRAICVHTSEQYGTVSSSLLAIGVEWSTSRYLHAEGPPCLTPYGDFSALLTDWHAVGLHQLSS
jgi:Transport and Golgi organisation 2